MFSIFNIKKKVLPVEAVEPVEPVEAETSSSASCSIDVVSTINTRQTIDDLGHLNSGPIQPKMKILLLIFGSRYNNLQMKIMLQLKFHTKHEVRGKEMSQFILTISY